jgi:predicted DNA-binding protein
MHGTIDKRGRKASVKPARTRPAARREPAAGDAPLILKITPRLNRALTRVAEKSGKPKYYHVRRALERYVEDTWDVQLAEESLKSTRRTYSMEEVKKRLGLED